MLIASTQHELSEADIALTLQWIAALFALCIGHSVYNSSLGDSRQCACSSLVERRLAHSSLSRPLLAWHRKSLYRPCLVDVFDCRVLRIRMFRPRLDGIIDAMDAACGNIGCERQDAANLLVSDLLFTSALILEDSPHRLGEAGKEASERSTWKVPSPIEIQSALSGDVWVHNKTWLVFTPGGGREVKENPHRVGEIRGGGKRRKGKEKSE
ncbi:hypothetical protein Tco_1344544 [Tanacetum coccineum]